nr:unnamed protein product [Callosobruchus chinensis]
MDLCITNDLALTQFEMDKFDKMFALVLANSLNGEPPHALQVTKEGYAFGLTTNMDKTKTMVISEEVDKYSILLYGTEAWTLGVRSIRRRRLEVFEMWVMQRMLKISWTKHFKPLAGQYDLRTTPIAEFVDWYDTRIYFIWHYLECLKFIT